VLHNRIKEGQNKNRWEAEGYIIFSAFLDKNRGLSKESQGVIKFKLTSK